MYDSHFGGRMSYLVRERELCLADRRRDEVAEVEAGMTLVRHMDSANSPGSERDNELAVLGTLRGRDRSDGQVVEERQHGSRPVARKAAEMPHGSEHFDHSAGGMLRESRNASVEEQVKLHGTERFRSPLARVKVSDRHLQTFSWRSTAFEACSGCLRA